MPVPGVRHTVHPRSANSEMTPGSGNDRDSVSRCAMAATVVIGRWGATHYGYLNDIPPMPYMLTCAAPLRDHAAT